MTRKSILAVLVASSLLLAGCAGGLSGGDTTPGTQSDTTDARSTDAPEGGTVSFYISDEKNAIGDFRSLNVTVTRVGFERAAGEGGGWIEHDVDNATVDLTELQGANATLLDRYELPNGTYSTVFVHVGDVNATLQNGDQVRVKLPSEKLQLTSEFAVENGSEIDFVFDITVHKAGNSGKYILKPVISESGTDVPIEATDEEHASDEGEDETVDERSDDEDERDTDADDEDRDTRSDDAELNVTFEDTVKPGAEVTVRVTSNGSAVANATVSLDGETVGTTDANGTFTVTVPDYGTVTLTVEDDATGEEYEREFGFDDEG